MVARHQKLEDALRLQQFLRDVEDEEDWIREKEPIAASTNRGTYGCVTLVYITSSKHHHSRTNLKFWRVYRNHTVCVTVYQSIMSC